MSLMRLMPLIVPMLLLSVSGMLRGAAGGEREQTALAAAAFAAILVLTAAAVNGYYWRRGAGAVQGDDVVGATRRNARLLVLAYAWGALAMYTLYVPRLSGLTWQHGWQYAAAMGLLAVLVFGFAHMLGGRHRERLMRVAMPLTAAQGIFAAGSLLFMATSGKLLTRRADWAANYVFLTLALVVMLLTAMAMRTQSRLSRS